MTGDERRQLRSEVRLEQSRQRANGENVTGIHETKRAIMERRKVQESLERATPSFLQDGHGLRGPQQAQVATIMDGVDGWGTNFQVKRRSSGGESGGGTTPAPQGTLLSVRAVVVDGSTYTAETIVILTS